MRIAGVVSEYNPFHNGHAYHLAQTRAAGATHVVAVMSGHFAQRGEPAFCDKWARARAAVRCGADLVLELPVPYCCAGAGVFAKGAVALLQAFGIDMLSFGAETADPARLQQTADAAADPDVLAQVRTLHANGTGYAAAMQQAVAKRFGASVAEVLRNPNDTLAVEYLKAAQALGCDFSVLAVARKGALHDASDTHADFASAAALRACGEDAMFRRYMPQEAYTEIFNERSLFADAAAFETAVLCALRTQSRADMEQYIADGSGLASRVFAASRSARNLPELYAAAKTKSVTDAKVRRAVLHCFLRAEKAWQQTSPPYLHVLAVNERGLELLHRAQPRLPLVTKHAEMRALSPQAQAFYALQCRATDLYTAIAKPKGEGSLEQTSAMQLFLD